MLKLFFASALLVATSATANLMANPMTKIPEDTTINKAIKPLDPTSAPNLQGCSPSERNCNTAQKPLGKRGGGKMYRPARATRSMSGKTHTGRKSRLHSPARASKGMAGKSYTGEWKRPEGTAPTNPPYLR